MLMKRNYYTNSFPIRFKMSAEWVYILHINMLNLEVYKQGFLYNSMHRYWYQADLQLITNILPISPISNNISQLYVGAITYPGPRFNIKMSSYQYRKSHCGGKTILRPSYLHNGISYTGKMTSLYWISPQVLNSVPVYPASSMISLLYFITSA